MADMLIKLFEIADDWHILAAQKKRAITIRKPIGPEKHIIINWVSDHFGSGWASETDTAIGFACYDATALGFFGPIGVEKSHRKQGTGKALLTACLLDMKLKGYGYAIVGTAENTEYYKKTVGAVEIPGSSPGIYKTQVRDIKKDHQK
jgi:GNAT superfamily N-acetyltransferase